MPIARLGPSVLAKLQSGGGQQFTVPDAWLRTSYGSGWPIQPVSAPRDVELPRAIDYPISVNATLTPRTGYGLMAFSALLEAFENVTECKMPVNLIHRELTSFTPHLIDKDGNEVPDHPYQWMCEAPDRKTPISVWLTRFLKSTKVYDAPAVYLHRGNAGIDGLHYIDGSTLFVIVDQWGNVPDPEPIDAYVSRVSSQPLPSSSLVGTPGTVTPFTNLTDFIRAYTTRQASGQAVPLKVPAYVQIIKGTPFSWWSADQVWYMPQSRRMNAPYGESFIEQAWSWIMVIVNITAFELGHYKTGNMPEGFITLPRDLFSTTDQINAAEVMYNMRMMNNPATERQRLRMWPEGTTYTATKKPDFPMQLYKQAWNNILHTIGIPPSEFGEIPGAGLGGKGFKEGAATDLGRNTLNPQRTFVASLFNYVLERDGIDDVKFELAFPMDEIDPDKQKTSVYEGMAHGTLTLNDALGQLNLSPVGNPDDPHNIANQHLIVAGSSIFIIEDMQTQNGLAVPSFTAQQAGQTGGAPVDPETAVEQTGATHSPEDLKTLMEAIRHIQESGTLDGNTVSVPSTVRPASKAAPVAAPAETPIAPEARAAGIAEEAQEHPELGSALIEQLVIDHLRVDPHYYDKRAPLEKHCGVCPEDDDYFGAPIDRAVPFAFPVNDHANTVEIVAMCPGGDLPPKPALWKPEGGEVDGLQEWVGGPQYVREEAAYLLDRSLGFMLVPVAYVAEADGEVGAAIYYTHAMQPPLDPEQYAPDWVERAAVLDYVLCQQDRGYHHNYGTHPDDPARPILYDNGLCLPVDSDALMTGSPFCALCAGRPLSDPTRAALILCRGDAATWHDVTLLVGGQAAQATRARLQTLLDGQCIPGFESEPVSDGVSDL